MYKINQNRNQVVFLYNKEFTYFGKHLQFIMILIPPFLFNPILEKIAHFPFFFLEFFQNQEAKQPF